MRRILIIVTIFTFLCPAALATAADGIDARALSEAMDAYMDSLEGEGNLGYLSWEEAEDGKLDYAYFIVTLPLDALLSGQYAGETIETTDGPTDDVVLMAEISPDARTMYIYINSYGFSDDAAEMAIYLDGASEPIDSFYDYSDGSGLFYAQLDVDRYARWAAADDLIAKFKSGNRALYFDLKGESFKPVRDLFFALDASVRYANASGDDYLNPGLLPALPALPANGAETVYTVAERACPFTMAAPEGDNYYYIVLAQSHEPYAPQMAIFLYPGETVETLVPAGKYAVFFATGESWAGEDALFGTDTAYYRLTGTLEFKQGKNGYYGNDLALPGNAREIAESAFPF
jgi:hypothetical protein